MACAPRSWACAVRTCADVRGAGGSEALTPPPRGDDGGDGGAGRGHSEEAEPHMVSHVEDRQEGRSSASPLDGGAAAAGRPAPHGAPAGRGEPPAAPELGGAVTAPPRPWTALHFRVSF